MRLGAHLQEANRLPEGLGNKWYAGPPEEEAHESVAGCAKSEQFVRHHDTTMTLFTKCYPPPLGTRINNTVPALKTTTVNRPVPALKKKRPSRREQKIQPPGPGAEKTQPLRPVPPRKKNTTAPSRLGKKYNRLVPPRKKKTTAPSRFGKKKRPPRPASEKNNNRPVPPRKKKTTVPSRQEFCVEKYRSVPSRQEFPPLYFASPALPPK